MVNRSNLSNQSDVNALRGSSKLKRNTLKSFTGSFLLSRENVNFDKSVQNSKADIAIKSSILTIKNSQNIIKNDRQQIVNLVHRLDNTQLIELYELLNLKGRDFNNIREEKEKEKEKGKLTKKDISEINALCSRNLATLVKLIYSNPEKALMRFDRIPSCSSNLVNMTHLELEKLVYNKVIGADKNEIKLASAIIEQKKKNYSDSHIGLLNSCIYDCKLASQILNFRGSIDANKSIITVFSKRINETTKANPKLKENVNFYLKTLKAENENVYKEATEWLEKYKHNFKTRSSINREIKTELVKKMQTLKQDIFGILENELKGAVNLEKQNSIKKKIAQAFKPIILDFVNQEIEKYDISQEEKDMVLINYTNNYSNIFDNVVGEVVNFNEFKKNRNVKNALSDLKQA